MSGYRADHVGSLLRPQELLQAREAYSQQRITEDELRDIEDASVLKALEMERQAGLDVLTDGEYRRVGWSAAMREALDGLVVADSPIEGFLGEWRGPNKELAVSGIAAMGAVTTMVAGAPIRQVRRIAGVEAAFLRKHAAAPWKITMPGAMSSAGLLFKPGITDAIYPTRQDLAYELVNIMRSEIASLQEDGASYIQLDSLHYVERVADPTIRARMIAQGEDPEEYLDSLIAIDNATIEGARGKGTTFGIHMCRGNNRSSWHADGTYDAIAEKAFGLLNVDRFLLEYDTERAGTFEPLRFVPRNKMVVLGLISSKEPQLESLDDLRRRIDEAARYVPLDNLAISPQCGFASTMLGNLLTWDEQRRKLDLVAETARKVWG